MAGTADAVAVAAGDAGELVGADKSVGVGWIVGAGDGVTDGAGAAWHATAIVSSTA